jgi:hypothetical protein
MLLSKPENYSANLLSSQICIPHKTTVSVPIPVSLNPAKPEGSKTASAEKP